MTQTGLKMGALGGPQTFGAQAARQILACHPEYAEICYYPTAGEALRALLSGDVAAFCAPEQMSNTGFHAGMHARMVAPGSQLHVVAETTHSYHCSLLGKPGASLEQVRRVLGHTGSVTQSRGWIESHLPGAAIEIVDTSSLGAARTVLDGDGSIASVGTPELARESGLVELAKEIDGGSVGSYWALSRDPSFSDTPTRLIVAGRFDGGQLSKLICALVVAGYALHTESSSATGKALYEYDYLLRFHGKGKLETVQAVLATFASTRLAGAFEARG